MAKYTPTQWQLETINVLALAYNDVFAYLTQEYITHKYPEASTRTPESEAMKEFNVLKTISIELGTCLLSILGTEDGTQKAALSAISALIEAQKFTEGIK